MILQKLSRFVPVLFVLIAFLALDAEGLKPRSHGQKPMFPVLSRLEVTANPAAGGTADVVASVTAWIPGEELSWKLDLPPGVAVVEGPLSWTGQLAKGETRTFQLRIRVPDGAPREVTAVVHASERPSIRSAATARLDPGGAFEAKAAGQRVTAGGTDYIQYQGTVVPR